ARGLVVVPAALRDAVQPRSWAGLLDSRAPHPLDLVARGRDQLPRHDYQHARARDVVDAHAALRLVGAHVRDPAACRVARALCRLDDASPRPPRPHTLLLTGARREPDPLPACLLVLRAPRGLHHGAAGVRDDLEEPPGLFAQAG